MERHILKTDPNHFEATWRGLKPFENRLDDRDFEVDDELLLAETRYSSYKMITDGWPLEYTGRAVLCRITYKYKGTHGQMEGWCSLGLENLARFTHFNPTYHLAENSIFAGVEQPISTVKPPLGIQPRWSHDENRRRNLLSAIIRYGEAHKPIPSEWLKEYNDLVWLAQEKAGKETLNG